jgi:hypothetical protein
MDLLVDCLEAVEVYLPLRRPGRPVVAVQVTDGGSEDVDARGDEFVDVFGGREECYCPIPLARTHHRSQCNAVLPSKSPVSAIPSSPPFILPLSASTAMP